MPMLAKPLLFCWSEHASRRRDSFREGCDRWWAVWCAHACPVAFTVSRGSFWYPLDELSWIYKWGSVAKELKICKRIERKSNWIVKMQCKFGCLLQVQQICYPVMQSYAGRRTVRSHNFSSFPGPSHSEYWISFGSNFNDDLKLTIVVYCMLYY